MRRIYYRLVGKIAVPCDLLGWGETFESADRIVAKTDVGTMHVSTVFLGIDHGVSDKGDPLLFETMIFDDGDDGYQERYSTWGEAEAGHARAVKHAEERLAKAMILLNQKVEREC